MNYPGRPEEQARSVPAITPDEILLPAPQLIIPAARDRQFPIRTADWLQLRSKIAGLSNPFPNIASLGWACVGIAAAAAAAYFPWIAADSQLPTKVQQQYAYISPFLGIVAVASTVVALFEFFIDRRMAIMRNSSVEDILLDMDAIYKPSEVAGSPLPLRNAQGKSAPGVSLSNGQTDIAELPLFRGPITPEGVIPKVENQPRSPALALITWPAGLF